MNGSPNFSGAVLNISSITGDIDIAKFVSRDDPKRIPLVSIKFIPGAASEKCLIRDGGESGPIIFDSSVTSGTSDARIEYYHRAAFKPYLKFSEGTYANAASLLVLILG